MKRVIKANSDIGGYKGYNIGLQDNPSQKYYLVDAEGNRYYADDKIESFLDECATDFYMKDDIGYTAAESVDCLREWAFNDAPKELRLSGVEHLYVPKELEDEYFDLAYTYASQTGYDMYEYSLDR